MQGLPRMLILDYDQWTLIDRMLFRSLESRASVGLLDLNIIDTCGTIIEIGGLWHLADIDLNLEVAPKVAIHLISHLRRKYARGKRHSLSRSRRPRLNYATGSWALVVSRRTW